jgi:hypothetical protein
MRQKKIIIGWCLYWIASVYDSASVVFRSKIRTSHLVFRIYSSTNLLCSRGDEQKSFELFLQNSFICPRIAKMTVTLDSREFYDLFS